MEVYILNNDLEIQGLLDSFISLEWNEKYYECGDFTFKVIRTDKTNALLTRQAFVLFGDKSGIIESITYSEEEDGIEYTTVMGRELTAILDRRINLHKGFYTGNVSALVMYLVKDNFVDCEDEARIIDNLEIDMDVASDAECDRELKNDSVLDMITDICGTYDIGFRITIDLPRGKFVFHAYEGTDYSIEQDDLPRKIFSRDYDNLNEFEFTTSSNEYKNTAYCFGKNNKNTIVNDDISGLDRFEIAVDASKIDDQYEQNVRKLSPIIQGGKVVGYNVSTQSVTATIPLEDYKKLIAEFGNEDLSNRIDIKTFDGSLIADDSLTIGDKITVIEKSIHLIETARITGIQYIYEGIEQSVNYTIGDAVLTIYDKLKYIK